MPYFEFKFTDQSVIAVGKSKKNRYFHYCPIDDFVLIIRQILEIKNHKEFRRSIIFQNMLGRKQKSGKNFNINMKYKVDLVLFILQKEGLIKKIKKGIYTILKDNVELKKFLTGIQIKSESK